MAGSAIFVPGFGVAPRHPSRTSEPLAALAERGGRRPLDEKNLNLDKMFKKGIS
jgi:hypothetical protein